MALLFPKLVLKYIMEALTVEVWLSVKSIAIAINTFMVQNLLPPVCCVLGKDTLQHFPLLGSLQANLNFSYICNKQISTRQQ